ncbi:unnamed protein product, partial [marine sediment metagenome]
LGKIRYRVYTRAAGSCGETEDTAEAEFRPKENGVTPEPRPEPVPEIPPETCAARITITFDKEVYYIGEEFEVVMEGRIQA